MCKNINTKKFVCVEQQNKPLIKIQKTTSIYSMQKLFYQQHKYIIVQTMTNIKIIIKKIIQIYTKIFHTLFMC